MARKDDEPQETGEMEEVRFSVEDYRRDAARAVEHAAAFGRAVVVDSEGRERVRISIPTTALPVYEPDDE